MLLPLQQTPCLGYLLNGMAKRLSINKLSLLQNPSYLRDLLTEFLQLRQT